MLWIFLAGAAAKVVLGIANGESYHFIDSFQFTFDSPSAVGHIHSQTIVNSPGHKLLVVPWDILNTLPTPWKCHDLVSNAKVEEKLVEHSAEVVAYDLTLAVEPAIKGNIGAFIVRCGHNVDVEYVIEFTNQQGFFTRHFDASSQGTLEQYIVFAIIAILMSPIGFDQWRLLARRQTMNDIAAISFIASLCFVLRILFFTAHLWVYAHNGMGLAMLLFVCEYLDMITVNCWMICGLSMVHGVYITRSEIPHSTERQQFLIMIGAFIISFLLSMMWTSFSLTDLEGFGLSRCAGSIPYIFVRLGVAIVAAMRGSTTGKDENVDKRRYLVRFSAFFAFWLASTPFIILTSDNWVTSSFRMEVSNVAMLLAFCYSFSPDRYGWLFSHIRATERNHPYSEFGLPNT